MTNFAQLSESLKELLLSGTVIPAHPLALNEDLSIDRECQQRLTKYYLSAGVGGIAVGVHTTQFEIRDDHHYLLPEVLRLASEQADAYNADHPILKIAGICGNTGQALKEARLAVENGYHLGLVSLGSLPHYSEKELIVHLSNIGRLIPLFGFYLQPAVGGRILSYDFWKAFAAIPNACAIKVAAFNRYQTLDVLRAVSQSPRVDEIALYTGNDDNIVADLLTPYPYRRNGQQLFKSFCGGLLGHWAVWTKKAVEIFKEIKLCIDNDYSNAGELLAKGLAVTEMNAAIFDTANQFHGCIAGIHEVLYRQGIMKTTHCLNPAEKLSPGQLAAIDNVIASYSELTDDEFVASFLANQ
jgi:dihydrodipicolinate synthase/N-acetylneuraminate lyase